MLPVVMCIYICRANMSTLSCFISANFIPDKFVLIFFNPKQLLWLNAFFNVLIRIFKFWSFNTTVSILIATFNSSLNQPKRCQQKILAVSICFRLYNSWFYLFLYASYFDILQHFSQNWKVLIISKYVFFWVFIHLFYDQNSMFVTVQTLKK